MTWQTILYFTSILLTGGLTGFLAWYAWRQPPLPGVRAYAGLALVECLLALSDVISMVSSTQAQALFWFNLRFLFTAIIPVIWLAFALAYSGQQGWLSNKLLTGTLVIPVITQVMLWSNGLHGLWVKQEVGFHQNGPFWIAETGARIPGLWFMVHSFYSLILLLAGIGAILFTAWRKRRHYRSQALLLSAGALVALITTLIPVFNLFPQAEFNPFIPGIGISALLYALAVFRFQFLKRPPAQESVLQMTNLEAQGKHSLAVFVFTFILFASGVAATGYVSYLNYEQQFRNQVESQLSAIAELKVSGLVDWRAERMADAEVIYTNFAFAALVQRSLEHPDDAQAEAQLRTWLDTIRNSYQYDRVFVLDTEGVERVSSPATPEPVAAHLAQETAAIIRSGQVTFLDFHRDLPDETIHLALLVPVYAEQDRSHPLGLLVLRIDPNVYLYPYINQWPTSSKTAETLLVRRDGNDVLYLNKPKFGQSTALDLRVPLEDTQVLAVKAVLGQTGIVEGVDYRGQSVVGYVCAVPDSPWFLVARMDTAEVYAPLRERLWQTALFFGALILTAGTGLVLVWRQQRLRYYRGQLDTLDALRTSEEKFRLAFLTSPDSIAITRLADGMFVSVNKGFEQISGYTQEEAVGKTSLEINIWKDPEDRRKVVEELRARGEVRNYGAPFLTENGEIYGLMSAAVLELNGVPHILAITRDITERKQAEEKVIASEVRYRRLFEAARDGILILDAETGTIEDVNPFLVEMLGYSPEEFHGKKVWELGFFKDIAANEAKFLELQQKEYVRYEDLPLETADGRQIEVEFVSNIYQVGHHRVIQCNIREITERVRAEKAVQSLSARQQALLAAIPDVIMEVDANKVYTWANQAGSDFFGEDVIGREAAYYFEGEQDTYKVVKPLFSGYESVIYVESWQRRKDGVKRLLAWWCQVLKDEQGNVTGALSSARDITEEKQAEEALRHAHERLRHFVDANIIGVIIASPSGDVIEANDYYLRAIGYTREEFEQGSVDWRAITPPEWLPADEHAIEELRERGTCTPYEKEYVRRNGTRVSVFLSDAMLPGPEEQIAAFVLDITERKQVEEALRESEDKFKYIFEYSMVGKSITQFNGGMQVNKALCDMLGYSIQEMQDKKWQEITHPDDIELTQNQIDLLVSGKKESVRFVKRFIHKNGSIVWVDLNSTIRRDGPNKPLYLMSAVIDITERKQAEVALHESEDKFFKAFQTSPYAITITRPEDGTFIEVNDAFISMTGLTREEALTGSSVGLKLWVNEEDRQRVVAALRAGQAVVDKEYPFRTKSGEVITGLFSAQVIQLSQGLCILSSINDITERKRAEEEIRKLNAELEQRVIERTAQLQTAYNQLESELAERKHAQEALRESEERFRSLSGAAFEAINVHDGGVLLDANEQYYAMFGYEPEELLGKQVMPLTIAPDAIETVKKEIAAGGVGPYESTGLRKDGTRFPMEIRVREMEYKEHKVRVAAIMDITERKRAEEALLQRTAQLETANKELEAFSYSISHDLRAPLRAMDGFSRILLEEYTPQLPTEAQRYLGLVRDNAQQMGHLIEDLLAFSRLSRQPLNKQTVDPAEIIRRVLAELRAGEEEWNVEVTIGDLPACEADPALLKQVWVNLLANALKFTRKREVARIEIGSVSIADFGFRISDFGLQSADLSDPVQSEILNLHSAIYYVRDNGVGFDMQYVNKLFGVFQRLHRSEEYEGTGVGLAIIQRIIHRHGGRIWAEAEVDKGATFFFTI